MPCEFLHGFGGSVYANVSLQSTSTNHPQVVSKHQVTLSLAKASWDVVWSEISAHNFMLGLFSVHSKKLLEKA